MALVRLLTDPRHVMAAARVEARRQLVDALAYLAICRNAWLDEPTRASAARYADAFDLACRTVELVWLVGGVQVPPSEVHDLAAGRLFISGFPLPVKLLRRLRRRVGAVAYRVPPCVAYPGMWN